MMNASDLQKRPPLRMVVLISDSRTARAAEAILSGAHVPLQYQLRGEGTATSEMTDILGLGGAGKSITLCMLPRPVARRLLQEYTTRLRLDRPGSGVAFTLPLSGISNPAMRLLTDEVREALKQTMEKEVEHLTENATHHLILAAVNQGFSEDVMEAAREAGAGGGTVIHARRMGLEETVKFWGISVQPEKELVVILADKGKKMDIMKAIGQRCGIHSPAGGIVLSLPVDAVAGMDTPPQGLEG